MADDLSQLASSGLPTLGGPHDNSWGRSFPSSKTASDSLWGGTTQTSTSAVNLLGGSSNAGLLTGRSLPELGRLSGSLENSSHQTEPRSEEAFLKWQENNEKHEIGILSRIVNRAEESTKMRSRELIELQLQTAWGKTKKLYAEELVGTRTLRGSATDTTNGPEIPLLQYGQYTENERTSFRSPGVAGTVPRGNIPAEIVRPHLEIVRHMNPNRPISEAAIELTRLTESSGLSAAQAGYANALKLAGRILTRTKLTTIEKAMGTMNHLSNQFQTWIINSVRQVGDAGNPSQGMCKSAMGNTICAFVQSELGSAPSSVWPALYYCMRVGDAVAAKDIFEASGAAHQSDGAGASILAVLSHLASRQGSSGSLWENSGPFALPKDHLRSVAEVCERSKAMDVRDIHKIGFLALMSGSHELPTSDSVSGFRTIEDYLFGAIWNALVAPDPEERLAQVGKNIRNFGANYFGDQESGGWSYALPLLVAQQYRTALSYLVNTAGATGLLQATHWGLMMALAGDELTNIGDESTSDNPITSMLTNYAKMLEGDPAFGSVAALEYLALIPNKTLRQKEIVSLILSTNEIDTLAGPLSPEGMRQNGVLDEFFSSSEISALLAEAGENLCRDMNTKDREKASFAGLLFMKAGSFRSVIMLLNRLLSPPDIEDENKRYWYTQAKQFHSVHLNKRCHVVEVLERDDQMNVVATNLSLMELYDFFGYLGRGEFDTALTLVDRQNLLPLSPSDVSTQEMKFKSLDPLLQRAIPAVLKGAMGAIYHQYCRTKGLSGAPHGLEQLKLRARALTTFAGMLPFVDSDERLLISRLETQMI